MHLRFHGRVGRRNNDAHFCTVSEQIWHEVSFQDASPQFEKEAEVALGLPPNVHSYSLLPIGYPMGRLGPVAVSRSPMSSMKIGGTGLAACSLPAPHIRR
jgi:hypothetical protein